VRYQSIRFLWNLVYKVHNKLFSLKFCHAFNTFVNKSKGKSKVSIFFLDVKSLYLFATSTANISFRLRTLPRLKSVAASSSIRSRSSSTPEPASPPTKKSSKFGLSPSASSRFGSMCKAKYHQVKFRDSNLSNLYVPKRLSIFDSLTQFTYSIHFSQVGR